MLMGDKDYDWFVSSDDVISAPCLCHEKGCASLPNWICILTVAVLVFQCYYYFTHMTI